jgi:hypothetical protein
MKVAVGIDMIEREPRGSVRLKLSRDLDFDLPSQRRAQRDLRPQRGEVVAQASAPVEEVRDFVTLAQRLAVDENDVQTDTQIGQRSRALDRAGRGGRANHQGRGAQDAAAVRCFDGGVDRFAEPEIVRRYDQLIQFASSRRSRRKAKNSTPSRSRRIVISGLRAISETIDAIFGARK